MAEMGSRAHHCGQGNRRPHEQAHAGWGQGLGGRGRIKLVPWEQFANADRKQIYTLDFSLPAVNSLKQPPDGSPRNLYGTDPKHLCSLYVYNS